MATRVITSLASPEWAALFTTFTDSAFRLEGLQHYTMDDEAEAFARFCAGQDPHVNLSWWTGLARGNTAAGRRMARVRVITEPPSDYTRFELAHYPAMVAAGDDIQVITTPEGTWPPGLPRHDFWLFDDRDVWILDYDHTGTFLGAELRTDPETVTSHQRWRDAAIGQAIPVSEYLAQASRNTS